MTTCRAFAVGLCLVALSAGSAAAADRAAVGVLAGTNVASAGLKGSDATNIDTGYKAGVYAGAFALWPATSLIGIQPEVAFSQKHFTVHDTVGTFKATEKWDWIEVPILARVTFWRKSSSNLFLLAGPAVGFRARAKEDSADVKDDVQSTDVSVVGGAGVEIGQLGLEVRYDGGVRDLNKDHRLGDALTVKSRAVGIMLMWRFH